MKEIKSNENLRILLDRLGDKEFFMILRYTCQKCPCLPSMLAWPGFMPEPIFVGSMKEEDEGLSEALKAW